MNRVIFTGNLCKDADVRYTQEGKPVCDMRFAVREIFKPENRPTLFLDIVLWGKRAESLSPYLKKGKGILVEGRLDVSKRNADNGKTYTNVKVFANRIEFQGKKDDAANVENTELAESEENDQ